MPNGQNSGFWSIFAQNWAKMQKSREVVTLLAELLQAIKAGKGNLKKLLAEVLQAK